KKTKKVLNEEDNDDSTIKESKATLIKAGKDIKTAKWSFQSHEAERSPISFKEKWRKKIRG
ncbi:hypothetical protein SK128_001950, partial [Halocaridina rubra]